MPNQFGLSLTNSDTCTLYFISLCLSNSIDERCVQFSFPSIRMDRLEWVFWCVDELITDDVVG